jgi:hypothetical protein
MKKIIFLMVVAFILFFQENSFCNRLVNDNCINEGNKPVVLIAAKSSQFKDSVLAVVKDSLEKMSYCVKIIPFGDLGGEILENYRAAIVVSTCQFGGIGCGASKFLKKTKDLDKKKILFFVTSGSAKWHPKKLSVDCVSSASVLNNAVSVADSVVAGTKKILSGNR